MYLRIFPHLLLAGLLQALPRIAAAMLLVLASAGASAQAAQSDAATGSCTGNEYYIPDGTFPEKPPASDDKRRYWYSGPLWRLGEPSLYCDDWPAGTEVYRFIWLHNLAHPVVIRVVHNGEQAHVYAFQLSGKGSGDPGYLLHAAQKKLSKAERKRLEASIKHSKFWSMPTSSNLYAAHGEQWIIEGRRDGQYHIVDRWLPTEGAYRHLGVIFFDLVDWKRPYSSEY